MGELVWRSRASTCERIWQLNEDARCVINLQNMVSVALHERPDFIQTAQTASYLGHNFEGGVGILRADRRGIVPIRDSPVTQADAGRTGDGTIAVRGWCFGTGLCRRADRTRRDTA